MKRFVALLKREYYENRGSYLITPLALAIISILGLIVMLSVQVVYDSDDFTLREGLRLMRAPGLKRYVAVPLLIQTYGIFALASDAEVLKGLLVRRGDPDPDCPICGGILSHEEGCVTCHSCGYSECS